jgi:hypothetical protein
MPYIMIKVTKDIAKLVTLMVEGITWTKLWSLNIILASYCDNFIKYET